MADIQEADVRCWCADACTCEGGDKLFLLLGRRVGQNHHVHMRAKNLGHLRLNSGWCVRIGEAAC